MSNCEEDEGWKNSCVQCNHEAYQNEGVFINRKSIYVYVPTNMSLGEIFLDCLSQA